MLKNVTNFIYQKVNEIRDIVGNKKIICAVSGGVDSMTTAVLCHKAVGENLTAIFIDDGLMRKDEDKFVKEELKKFGITVKIYERKNLFLNALRGLTNPEEKRLAFRETFYKVFKEVIKEENAHFLAQGTIKADIIETEAKIKTQHNVLSQIGINPKKYGLEIIEPLKDLLKPEVRKVAKRLGLSKEVYQRAPFPGPGLLCRILGEVTEERIEIIRKATEIVEKLTKNLRSFQTFPVLLSDKATGIKDFQRILGDIIVIRSVDSKDALSAKAKRISYPLLKKIRDALINEIPSCVKVLYDITDKPPSTIEYI
uniref:GMP synthase (glutamine-hydrolyzing) n=1 Tax=candidate division WOR-3 bacterium TaxID=2052148 RepID=A0A7V5XZT5_UNCW3